MLSVVSLIISIQLTRSIVDICDDNCLLSKLQIDASSTNIMLKSYDIANHKFIDNSLLWINPSQHFSNSFLKKITNLDSPSNDDFRRIIYQKYVSNQNKLILSVISSNHSNDNHLISIDNHQHIQKLSALYQFDGIQYEFESNGRSILSFKDNRRQLQSENGGFDVLNQNTYSFYDWFLLIFSLSAFGCFCMCCGGFVHKCYTKDKMVSDEDIQEFRSRGASNKNMQHLRVRPVSKIEIPSTSPSHTAIDPNTKSDLFPSESPPEMAMPPRIAVPTNRGTISEVQTPDVREQSETHVSIDLEVKRTGSNTISGLRTPVTPIDEQLALHVIHEDNDNDNYIDI